MFKACTTKDGKLNPRCCNSNYGLLLKEVKKKLLNRKIFGAVFVFHTSNMDKPLTSIRLQGHSKTKQKANDAKLSVLSTRLLKLAKDHIVINRYLESQPEEEELKPVVKRKSTKEEVAAEGFDELAILALYRALMCSRTSKYLGLI